MRTEEANPASVTGTFTLILHGGGYYNDLKTVAFLDLEGDAFVFEPYAPAFDYRVEKGVPAREALHKAENFVSGQSSFLRPMLIKILDRRGNAVGYELRPLYFPLTYGYSDILDIAYWEKDGKIKIIIRNIPSVENRIFDGHGLMHRR